MKYTYKVATALMAVALTTLVAAFTVNAAAPALTGQIVLRPVTPGDVTVYHLPSTTETSGGLNTVGVGTAVYLEAEVNIAIPASDIVSVAWAATNLTTGLPVTLAPSPLGTNVPVYSPSQRLLYQEAGPSGRAVLRPDKEGQYIVVASIVTGSSGTTNVTKTITAATYRGINTCALCHSGGIIAEDKFHPWSTTAHSMIFSNGINGYLGHYTESCVKCHTVGYDTFATATNGGFDDMVKLYGWVNGATNFPAVLTNSNWANLPAKVRNVANIQCENCHGPGSQHADSLGDTSLITKTLSSGDCNQCHDAPTHHVKGTEWYNSMHAVATTDPAGNAGCIGCHTGAGFIGRISGTPASTGYSAIGCQTCHEPHGETMPTNGPNLLRTLASVTLKDGTVVTTAGKGALCMNCHMSRQNATNYVETASASSHYGPHHGTQGDMLMGVNAVTYGKTIPSSAHRDVVADTCVTCHMQTVDPTNSVFLKAGGHTFKPAWEGDATHAAVDLTAACVQCHGQIASFDFPRQDYDGNGVVEGVQTEVQHLLDKLGYMLPPVGVPKSTIAIDSSWTKQQLKAGYNYLFVQSDGSLGIHNLAYTVGILKASIADLSGDANNDGIADWWQIKYFGSITNPDAAPNASPAGDGVPNWLKYSLGLDPTIKGMVVPDGVVWASGKEVGNPDGTNTVHIYTAAEVAFDSQVDTNYYIQEVSALSGGWQTIAGPIAGTGAQISYVTPTRKGVQQYFRVYHTP